MTDWKELEQNLKKKLFKLDSNVVDLSLENDFLTLYRESAKDNYHWQYCMFDVYKSNFNYRFEQYKEKFPDAELVDFVESELLHYKKHENKQYRGQGDEVFYDIGLKYRYHIYDLENLLSYTGYRMLSMTQDKKIKYLEDLKNNTENDMQITEPKEEFLDNSQVEKIAYLEELGILDFLNSKLPDNISDANKGKLISKFTGINSSNISRSLSALKAGKTIDKNYPLKKDTVKSIKAELMKLDLLNIFYPKE